MKDINFDFKQLQAFLAVIETGSFTAAAKKLNLTQSSISQQIANLENGLKTEVINRSQRPIQMTIAGQALYPLGKKIIDSGCLSAGTYQRDQSRAYFTFENRLCGFDR